MNKLLCFFAVFLLISPAFATGEVEQPTLDKTAIVAAASYVEGAYNAINQAKQDKLTSTNVVASGTGVMVMDVSANNGTVTVTKSEVTIPVGAMTSENRAIIWLE